MGIGILVLLAALVIIKQRSTGAVLDVPKGELLIQVVNIFSLLFVLGWQGECTSESRIEPDAA